MSEINDADRKAFEEWFEDDAFSAENASIAWIAWQAALVYAREQAVKTINHSLCDQAEDMELFMAHRDYFAELVQDLGTKKEAPPRL